MTDKQPCFIKAKGRNDYVYKGLIDTGNRVIIPYRDNNLFLRLMREAWFRLNLPGRQLWYNPELRKLEEESVTIYDPLITSDFLRWLCDRYPSTMFHVNYSNRVNTTGIKPTDVVRPNLDYASFDEQDCAKYGMKFVHAGYMAHYSFTHEDKLEPEYDIIYLGRDKGRAEKLLEWQSRFEELGLKTYFHICADRSFLRFKKPFYKKEIPYSEYVDLLKRTRAHLNYVQEGQTSISQRDLESVFDEVKCITNNKGIKSFKLYHPSRFFVLGEDDLETLPAFLDTPFVPVPEDELKEYGNREKASEKSTEQL